jgi:hypothetical protein
MTKSKLFHFAEDKEKDSEPPIEAFRAFILGNIRQGTPHRRDITGRGAQGRGPARCETEIAAAPRALRHARHGRKAERFDGL